jgi:hypothetical protein
MLRGEFSRMERFRLKAATMSVHYQGGGPKGVAVMIPAGSEVASVNPIDTRAQPDRSSLIEVKWAGRIVHMFLYDLLERGERVTVAVDR